MAHLCTVAVLASNRAFDAFKHKASVFPFLARGESMKKVFVFIALLFCSALASIERFQKGPFTVERSVDDMTDKTSSLIYIPSIDKRAMLGFNCSVDKKKNVFVKKVGYFSTNGFGKGRFRVNKNKPSAYEKWFFGKDGYAIYQGDYSRFESNFAVSKEFAVELDNETYRFSSVGFNQAIIYVLFC